MIKVASILVGKKDKKKETRHKELNLQKIGIILKACQKFYFFS
jgi:hypothetical protein